MTRRISDSAEKESKSLDDRLADVMSSLVVTTSPVVVCGVQRKVNIGDFETIDIYCALALPIKTLEGLDQDVLHELLVKAAEEGFHYASTETLKRYQLVKESAKR